ncbi:MAG TPA: retropepsin-like aspartic protease [Stellaceae bacterium]|nr:retropepsin-like aspartic protease [Stellaceae bacterium]
MRQVDLSYPPSSLPLTKPELMAYWGPMIEVEIGFDPTYDPAQPQKVPNLVATGVRALIDTGAMMSYIDLSLVGRLQLPEIDKETVAPVLGGPREIVTYLGQIYIPSLAFTVNGHFGGVELIRGHFNAGAVLGREFLINCQLAYDGPSGQVTLSRW